MADEALSNELLWLAGETDGHVKHSRKRQASGHKSSKRRKHEMTDSDADDDSDDGDVPKYPLEGKYIDEEDKERLWEMPEIKREDILSKRAEEMQKAIQARNLRAMVHSQAKGGTGVDSESVARAAKRKHTGVGHSDKKSAAIKALSRKRAEKETRARRGDRDSNSPVPKRAASDMEDSSSDDEEGQVHKRSSTSSLDGVQLKHEEGKITVQDLSKARITRDMIEHQCMSSQFEDYVKGGWVRVLLGMDKGQSVYRLCEVTAVVPETVESYPLGNRLVNQLLELRHAGQVRHFPMSKLSCGAFTDKEFDRLILQFEADKVKPPSRAKLTAKKDMIHKMDNTPRTEAELAYQLSRQRDIRGVLTRDELLSRRATLGTERKLAAGRGDTEEVARLSAEIAKAEAENGGPHKPSGVDIASIINQRNRMSNLEAERAMAVRLMEARKQGKGLATGRPIDLSARVKTVVRTRYDGGSGAPSPAPASPAPSAVAPIPVTAEPVASPLGSKVDRLAQAVVIEDLF